ncbi:MAG TPA: T9SS type A sorting domain-containing protein, partial [Chitinophagales bacterium]|nr:T9SS type A sorting domain-containing protein [Chitinophagales bacterium]
SDFAVVRYNIDGSLDNNFGTGGKVTTALGSFGEVAYSMVIQNDGKIILAGFSHTTNSNFFALARYNTDGSLDATFGSGGIVTTHVGLSDDQCYSVTLQSDGKIVAAGYSHNGTDDDFAVVRYNTDGSLDNTFDFDGIVTTPVGTSDEECYSVAIQPDGKIVAAGFDVNTFTEYAVVRYNSDGSLDNSFGSTGKVTTDIGVGGDDANEVVVQTDGKILVAGNSSNGSNYDFGLVRYKSDGSIDSTFGTNGIITTDFASGNDFCLSLLIQSDGKIIGAGFGAVIGRDFVVARYDNEIANGISENIVDNSSTINPNPFSDEITINTTGDNVEVIIFDATGKEVSREKTFGPETKISTAHLSPGFYFIRFFDGNRTVNVKAIKLQ